VRFCRNAQQNRDLLMRGLAEEEMASDYGFYDSETTEPSQATSIARQQIPNTSVRRICLF
jgi:hypothetical protein